MLYLIIAIYLIYLHWINCVFVVVVSTKDESIKIEFLNKQSFILEKEKLILCIWYNELGGIYMIQPKIRNLLHTTFKDALQEDLFENFYIVILY